MPIYEYECAACRARFEHLLKTARDLPAACPACGGRRLSRVLSAFAVGASQAAAPACAAPGAPGAACSSCSSGRCPYSAR